MHAGAYVLGPCLRAGCAHAAWEGGRSWSDTLGAGRRCLTPLVSGGSWSSPDPCEARLGGGDRARGRVAGCVPEVQSRACVDAWSGEASGDSLRAVAPVSVWGVGMLIYGDRVDYGNTSDNAYSQGVQELNASAGAC
jgi:hypothetical protein